MGSRQILQYVKGGAWSFFISAIDVGDKLENVAR